MKRIESQNGGVRFQENTRFPFRELIDWWGPEPDSSTGAAFSRGVVRPAVEPVSWPRGVVRGGEGGGLLAAAIRLRREVWGCWEEGAWGGRGLTKDGASASSS